MRDHTTRLLIVLYTILNFADCYTTYILLRTCSGSDLNPLINILYRSLSPQVAFLLSLAFTMVMYLTYLLLVRIIILRLKFVTYLLSRQARNILTILLSALPLIGKTYAVVNNLLYITHI